MHYNELMMITMSVAELEAAIRHHNHLYWDLNQPEISDYEFDRLVRRLRELEPNSPVLEELGAQISERFGSAVSHRAPMLSLDKCYDDRELLTWANGFSGLFLATPKMDGVAASVRYDRYGRLRIAATRGSGTVGEDITFNAQTIKGVLHRLVCNPRSDEFEIRGEIVCPLSVFQRYKEYCERHERDAMTPANPRNLAAGTLRLKEKTLAAETAKADLLRDFIFMAYDLDGGYETEAEKFAELNAFGFITVEYRLIERNAMTSTYEAFAAKRAEYDYEIDGVVFKVNEVSEQRRVGVTAHHPRYAIAYKFQGESGTTRLIRVEWNVARTGAITPVAHIEPISLSGATISRASLHHAGYIDKLKLSLGAKIVVTRRGGVIPNVEFVVEPGTHAIEIPARCPSCHGDVTLDGDFLYCKQPSQCRLAVIASLSHYCKIVDIQGFGEKVLERCYERGMLKSPVDLYRLTESMLLDALKNDAAKQSHPEKLARKLLEQIDAHRELPLDLFLRALGINELGKHVAMLLSEQYRTLEQIRALDIERLAQLHSVGPIIAKSVVVGLRDNATLIDELLRYVTIIENESRSVSHDDASGALVGKSFVFTGKLLSFDRETAQKRVRALGGSTPSNVTQDLDFLVVGDGKEAQAKSSKQKKAEQLMAQGKPIRILSEREFLALTEDS